MKVALMPDGRRVRENLPGGEVDYPLSPEGVFHTIQGEGALLGLPMTFIRLAGCPVNCPECDTNYQVSGRATLKQILDRCAQLRYGGVEWAWITGGEPAEYDLLPLVNGLHALGYKVALATAGTRPVQSGFVWGGVDFLSVSPHDPATWKVRRGDQLNLVPGLNGLSLRDPALLEMVESCWRDFPHRYVTPCAGKPETLDECLWWVRCRRGWRLGCQAHKVWGLP